ncbi:MAG TPA: CdaR family protein [Candidatus Limnocylindria bacterium]|nr:CdaR family protein [Candidatus Limnocylindria bacterium]
MKRILRFLWRNWPLKLAAVLLATLLYSGLVLSQNERVFTGIVPIEIDRPPAGAQLLNELEPVREIRFRAPLDVGALAPAWFRASIDLARVEPRASGEPQEVSVSLVAIDPRVQIVDFAPRIVQVRLDSVEEREMPVRVDFGSVPEGISIGTPQTDPSEVTLRGASSRLSAVRSVVARVTIDASALNVDRDVELLALDDQGNQIAGVELEPSRANVRIAVAVELANRTLPVVPQIVGELGPGYELSSVVVAPLTITVSGAQDVITRLETAPTEPLDVSGRTRDFESVMGLDLPAEVTVIGPQQVRVSLTIGALSGSRSYLSGLTLAGASPELTYRPAVTQVTITLSGPVAELEAVSAGQLVGQLEVQDLEPGTHLVPVVLVPPAGLELLSVSPADVTVIVEAPVEEGGRLPLAALAQARL